jgi:hypothetical protein
MHKLTRIIGRIVVLCTLITLVLGYVLAANELGNNGYFWTGLTMLAAPIFAFVVFMAIALES